MTAGEKEQAVKNKGNVLTKRQHDTDTNNNKNREMLPSPSHYTGAKGWGSLHSPRGV